MNVNMVRQYRLRTPVEAMQWDATEDSRLKFERWFERHGISAKIPEGTQAIMLPDGSEVVVGDWIILGEHTWEVNCNDLFHEIYCLDQAS